MHAFGRRYVVMVAMAVSACTQVPAVPDQPPSPVMADTRPVRANDPISLAITTHRQLALKLRDAGDLAGAAEQWQILTLLVPEDATFRKELEATRVAIRQGVAAQLQVASAAQRSGDTDRAVGAYLRTLALDPENAEAAKALREIERQKLARIAQDRSAKLKPVETAPAPRSGRNQAAPPAEIAETFDIDQRIELLQAGDVAGGLRELHAYVQANPNDRAARQRIGAAVYERGRELERKGAREQALTSYEEAISFRGDAPAEWAGRVATLRKALSEEYYEIGMRAYRTDVALAIAEWEKSLRFDPKNIKSASRLQEARLAQEKLQRIQTDTQRK